MSTTQTTTEQRHIPKALALVTGSKKISHTAPRSLKSKNKSLINSNQYEKNRNAAYSRPSTGDRNDGPPPTKKSNIEKDALDSLEISSLPSEKGLHSTKRAGDYLLGPKQGSSPVKCIQQYLARKDGTDEFYIIKMLTMKGPNEKETMDDIQGKTLLHTEHTLSSLLKFEEGVVHEHGMFRVNYNTVLETCYGILTTTAG
ncbi:unnamed protein product [Orchesella dallaii]|uniref:Uncharacterized protein n=1 Tax=Orchesella dallaii TaxID=48710 RepID=A0ABP1S353_9HEXA